MQRSDGVVGGVVEPRLRMSVSGLRGQKISQSLARHIARDIAEQGLAPGVKLPHEVTMAQEFGVGRNSVREALRLLEAQGLIEIRPGPGGGPVVVRPSGEDLGRTMTLFLQMRGITIGEVLDAQVDIDGLIAARAAAAVKSLERKKIDELVAASQVDLAGLGDDDWLRASMAFHHILQGLVPNRVIPLLDEALRVVLSDRARRDQHISWPAKERKRVAVEHRDLTDAICAGDVEQARAIAQRHQERSNRAIGRFYPGLVDELIDWH